MRTLLASALSICLILPASGAAQERRLHIDAGAGFYVPNTFGKSEDRDLGWLLSARLAVPVGTRLELFAHYTYGRAAEIGRTGTADDFVRYGLQEQVLVAGGDVAIGRGFRAELAAGAVSRRNTVHSTLGMPDPSFFPDGRGGRTGPWTASAVAVPGVAFRFADGVTLRLRDMLILDDVTGTHNLSLTMTWWW